LPVETARGAGGTLDATCSGMLEKHDVATQDPCTDFTQFLSGRLGTDDTTALSELGAFLLAFEPSWRRSAGASADGHRLSPLR
jgi:hypothetical protein